MSVAGRPIRAALAPQESRAALHSSQHASHQLPQSQVHFSERHSPQARPHSSPNAKLAASSVQGQQACAHPSIKVGHQHARSTRPPCILQHTRTAQQRRQRPRLVTPSVSLLPQRLKAAHYARARKSRITSRLLRRHSQVQLSTPRASITTHQRELASMVRAFIFCSSHLRRHLHHHMQNRLDSVASQHHPANAANIDQVCKRPANTLSLLPCSALLRAN